MDESSNNRLPKSLSDASDRQKPTTGRGSGVKLIVVAGPTASGKSRLAIEIAKEFSGEIVSADSMQVYRTLDIGTAKIRPGETQGILHHMIDIADPSERYSLADYLRDAKSVIDGIVTRGNVPVICGGTGLYISSLINGVHMSERQIDESLRDAISNEYEEKGGALLLAEIEESDPQYAKKLHANDKKRIVRALELIRGIGTTPSEENKKSLLGGSSYDSFDIILNYKDRQTLYSEIEKRVDSMMDDGLLEEARYVYENRESFITAAQAIGYKEFFAYLDGKASLDNCVAQLKQASRRYAKRQITWFTQYAPNRFYWKESLQNEDVLNEIKKHLKL